MTSGASKGGLKGQLAYDEAALTFSNRQRASINALDAVEQEVDLYVNDLLCSLVRPCACAVAVVTGAQWCRRRRAPPSLALALCSQCGAR